ncbi:MFS transporter [Niveispirillum sp. KHB5.9]|uniref:MFS transporter n=1 Tax=Niveispirillum sp. KHB5.9 TaxID=3400269 RepID=UPI003A88B0B1
MTAAATDASPQQAGRLGLLSQVGYGAGQVAGQVFRDVPSLLLLFFMTTVLGIEPALAGAAIFVPKLVWGVGCDMLVGILSDRWKQRFHRRWWLLAGVIGSPAAFLLLFHVPMDLSTQGRVAYVAGAFSLYMAVFASFSVPYLAIAGELSDDPHQRTILMSWRLVFTAAGVLVGGALAPGVVQYLGGGQPGYEGMARVLAVICPLSLLIAFFGAGRASRQAGRAPAVATGDRLTARAALAVLAHPRFSVLLTSNLLQLTGSGMAYAAMLYFLTYNMGQGAGALQLIGGLIMVACAGIIVAQPMWVALARKVGKKPVYVASAIGYALTYIIWSVNAGAGTGVAYGLCFIAAIFNSGWALLSFSMMSDIAGEDRAHAGLYSAAWIAVDKIGFALGGTLLVGIVLSSFGFDVARSMAGLPQEPRALTGVMLAFGVLPGLFNLTAAALYARFGRH